MSWFGNCFVYGKSVIFHYVLHIPTLCSPLLSIFLCFCCLKGCSFFADDTSCFLTFLHFILPVDDTSDCTILGPPTTQSSIDFDSWVVALATAVSDNTCFRWQHWPAVNTSMSWKKITTGPLPDTICLDSSSIPLGPISNDDTLQETLKELNFDFSLSASPTLTAQQISEISTVIVNHLKKHGRVTTTLINFMRDGHSSPSIFSTTPVGCQHSSLLVVIKCPTLHLHIFDILFNNFHNILAFAL